MGFNKKDFILRLLVIIIAVISPFIYIGVIGEMPSISAYWGTPIQPMFIIVNALTSYFLFSIDRWRISAILLLLLTSFSFNVHPILHNVFSISFFLFNFYPIILNKKVNWCVVPYTASVLFLFHSILYAEIFAIIIICAIHLYGLIRYYTIKKERENNLNSYTA